MALFPSWRERLYAILHYAKLRSSSAVLVAQLQQSLRLQRVAIIIQSLGIVGFATYFWAELPRTLLVTWIVIAALSVWSWVAFRLRFVRIKNPELHIRALLRTWMVLAVWAGLVWGIAGFLFLFFGTTEDNIIVVAGLVAIVFASLPAHSCWLPGLTAFTLLTFSPMAGELAIDYGFAPTIMALVLTVITCYILYAGVRLNELVRLAVSRENENQKLVARLKAEKAMAESARRATAAASARHARFFAGANHDLRQPLQAMGIYLQILKGQAQGAEKEVVDQLDSSARSISSLVEQLLEVSRIETGRLEVHLEAVSLEELFSSLSAEFAPQAAAQGLRWECQPLPLSLHTDPLLLTRILRNLLTNALRYTTRPGALIALTAAQSAGGILQIAVRDEGEGIAAEDRTRIFEAFYRGEAGKKAAGGFGLGLSVVRGLAQRLDIPVTVQSEVGKGSTFTLSFLNYETGTLPAAAPAADSAAPAQLEGVVGLLEDNDMVREALSTMLTSWGAQVVAAAAPSTEFLDRMIDIAGKGTLRGLVTDYNLGEGQPTGLETIFFIRAAAKKRFPAVLLTAVAEDEIRAAYRMLCLNPDNSGQRMPIIVQKPATAASLARALQLKMPRRRRKGN